MIERGRFVVLEGNDGCGKSTQTGRLVRRLEHAGHMVVATVEPDATELGHTLRRVLLGGELTVTPRAEALLMAAVEGVQQARAAAVVEDLVLRAFDEAYAMLEAARAEGIQIDPFRGETLEERAARTERYAGHVRNVTTDDACSTRRW